jgi:hypothetical protein
LWGAAAAAILWCVKRFLSVVIAVALLGGACLAVLVGATWNWLACENEGTEACRRQELASTQLTVAIVGIAPALALVVATALGRRWLAAVALALGLAIYIAWAVLLDAAIHGWDDLKLVP